ncbi:FHA domain-containing protein [Thermophilibacter provencensis]|uniref:FHA domain-containing protein n=1 Tax=Thermophilibacter provencensis TaxID=1852386 RepID=UPI002942F6CB|nr:FHA domain-containing protein [Thermophilibacter provencensis]
MDFVRCERGHFYDRGANPGGCPFCAQLDGEKGGEAEAATVLEPEPVAAPEPAPAPEPEPTPTSVPEPASFSPAAVPLDEDLTVGWLVCVAGPARGRSYALTAGRTFIGRAADMDVPLTEDPAVAERRQASVVFDPRTGRFSVTANETRELTYVNDELVYDHRDLREHDVLTLGSTRLLLVPLCGAGFSWAGWPA